MQVKDSKSVEADLRGLIHQELNGRLVVQDHACAPKFTLTHSEIYDDIVRNLR